MLRLPLADPGTPDLRSGIAFTWWIVKCQRRRLAVAVPLGIVWMTAQALVPFLIGRAIDDGLGDDDTSALLRWAGVLVVVGGVQALAGMMRHRFAVSMWLDAAYRTMQLVSAAATRAGSGLSRRVSTGEVVSVGSNDVEALGNLVDPLPRAGGAIVSFFVVAGLLLSSSTTLGLVVLIGVPLMMLVLGPLLSPLQRREHHARELRGRLNTRGADIVGGLRVLRGIGGEEVFHHRYRDESQRVRHAGVHVGRMQSIVDALQVLLPGLFVVVVVWLGARLAVRGDLSAGELIAFYGWTTFLVLPLRTVTEVVTKAIQARVAGDRIVRVLRLEPDVVSPASPAPAPSVDELVDEHTGLVAAPGLLTAVALADREAADALADRLGRYVPGRVTLDGVPLERLDIDVVRRRVLVHDTGVTLFSGTLRSELDPAGTADDATLYAALGTASADDVLDALPDGLDAVVDERGRSFSGGQRQRVALARALVRDPEVLVLVEPTSAVDAHTEARIAERLVEHRRGRTTVVLTSSPLVLGVADRVVLLTRADDTDDADATGRPWRVRSEGTHHDLLRHDPAYRAAVTRETEGVDHR